MHDIHLKGPAVLAGGFTGGVQGFGKGLLGTAFRPFKGLYLSGAAAGQLAGIKGPHQVYLIQKRGSPVKPPKAELGHDDVERRWALLMQTTC